MAKQGYPGLILVPPSDRSVVRRRFVLWSLLIIAIAGGALASSVWLLPPDNDENCEVVSGRMTFANFKECGRSGRSVAEAQLRMGKSINAGALEGQDEPHSSMPVQKTHQFMNPHIADQDSMTNPYALVGRFSKRGASARSGEVSVANWTNRKPASRPSHDARLAEQGDAFAQYRLGRFYARLGGSHAPESVSWYVKASGGLLHLAETGNGEAMYVLGVMYAFGRGVAKDREQARLWLTQAVDREISAAHLVLAGLDGHRSGDSMESE
jgi:uncharacterized protein